MSASIGIAAGCPGDSAEDLLRQADVAMYGAKAGGKGRWVVYKPSMLQTVRSRHDVGAELQLAVDRGEFQLRYQPVVSLESGRIVGAEALVRWNHPTRGEVGPDEFIGNAEENAMIVPIGRWVLGEACREAAGWGQQAGGTAPWVAANLSARQLLHPTLLDDVSAALAASGLPAGQPRAGGDRERPAARCGRSDRGPRQAARDRGIQIALDDFGTGYSSLSYLHRFPIDILKIAQGFVDVDDANDERWILAQAIISLGKALGLTVIAEGVERRAQVQRLKAAGCEFGTGLLLRPAAARRDDSPPSSRATTPSASGLTGWHVRSARRSRRPERSAGEYGPSLNGTLRSCATPS